MKVLAQATLGTKTEPAQQDSLKDSTVNVR